MKITLRAAALLFIVSVLSAAETTAMPPSFSINAAERFASLRRGMEERNDFVSLILRSLLLLRLHLRPPRPLSGGDSLSACC